jgi:hypothetical protein
MSQMPSTPSPKESFKKRFMQQDVNYFNFSLLLDSFMLNMFPFIQQFPFARSINHPFFGKYVPWQSIRHTSFCVGLFSCVVMFYGVFSPFFPPSLLNVIHIIGLTSIVHFVFDHFVS